MNKIKIFTDSTNDLSKELIQNMDIDVLPLYVTFNDNTYKDGVTIKPQQLFEKVDVYGKLPKTAALTPKDFIDAFRPYVDQGYDIIYISISSHMSSTYQNAVIASNEFDGANIEIVDSYNLSTGIGMLVWAAYDYIQMGYSVDRVAEKVRNHTQNVTCSFIIDTLDYLYKGGRCNALQTFFSSMLKIRPIIKVGDGKMYVGNKVRGKKIKGLNLMIDDAIKQKGNLLFNRVIITHTIGSEDEEIYIREKLQEALPGVEIFTTTAGCVISSHCGKNTIGIIYIKEK